jgi:hypothetical protein
VVCAVGLYCDCRWSDQPETVLLQHIPHKPLTKPAKLADFDFCAPAGSPYPKELQASLDVTMAGRMNGLVMWFDLHLAEGVSISSGGPWCTAMSLLDQPAGSEHGWRGGHTSSAASNAYCLRYCMTACRMPLHRNLDQQPQALHCPWHHQRRACFLTSLPVVTPCTSAAAPLGFTTGGRACEGTHQHQHYWGQALHYLAAVAAVEPGAPCCFRKSLHGERKIERIATN